MARPIWKGFISFGLVAIPVSIISLEEKNTLHFHLLDSRDKSRISYKRINSETGKEVPWEKIVKGYEFDKDNYIVLKEEDFKKASPDAYKSIDIEEFVNIEDIPPMFFYKPYYLISEGKNKKAYVLLREALQKTKTVGVGKVIIRTKQYLSIILPYKNALILNLIRFQEEMLAQTDLDFPAANLKKYKITEQELKMATDLVQKMKNKFNPAKYHDEYHDALLKWIKNKTKGKMKSTKEVVDKSTRKKDDVIDFVALLKKSMQSKSKGRQHSPHKKVRRT